MDLLLHKLNYKGTSPICLFNAPADFWAQWKQQASEVPTITQYEKLDTIEFALAFVTTQEQINELVPVLVPKLQGDALFWLAYPKGSSKRYRCDFNRDTGWTVLGQHGFESVRMVAIDEDWSAIRFRRNEYVKTMKRDPKRALSEGGKAKSTHQ